MDWSLYVITDAGLSRGRSHLEVMRAAIAGGATVVQFRDKSAPTRQLVADARALLELARRDNVPLIVNDRVDVALAVDADGVHVGQDDMPVALTRKLVGPGKIVGVSVQNLDQARRAEHEGADYLGAGPVFATATKPDAAPPIGIEGLAEICRGVTVPVLAIGGISAENAAAAIRAGAAGVAVVSAVVAAEDVEAAARAVRAAVVSAREVTTDARP